MKKTVKYILLAVLSVAAMSCQKEKKEGSEPTMTGVFYADIPGDKEPVEIAPGANKTYSLKACVFQGNVTDITINFSFKADPDIVEAYNTAHGTTYQMCPPGW